MPYWDDSLQRKPEINFSFKFLMSRSIAKLSDGETLILFDFPVWNQYVTLVECLVFAWFRIPVFGRSVMMSLMVVDCLGRGIKILESFKNGLACFWKILAGKRAGEEKQCALFSGPWGGLIQPWDEPSPKIRSVRKYSTFLVFFFIFIFCFRKMIQMGILVVCLVSSVIIEIENGESYIVKLIYKKYCALGFCIHPVPA